MFFSTWYRSSNRASDSWRVQFAPERWLIGAMIGSVLFVVGIFWFGWTGNYASVHWIVPLLAVLFWGAGVVMLFISFSVCYPAILTHSIASHVSLLTFSDVHHHGLPVGFKQTPRELDSHYYFLPTGRIAYQLFQLSPLSASSSPQSSRYSLVRWSPRSVLHIASFT